MLTVSLVLSLVALLLAIGSAVERVPLWVSVLVLCVLELLRALPLGR